MGYPAFILWDIFRRKFATTVFYLNKEGEMMYWGGDYKNEMHVVQQRRGVMVNAAILNTSSEGVSRVPIEMGPILEFKVIAGAPLRSRLVHCDTLCSTKPQCIVLS